jgi:peptidylprolyl isomerase
LASELRQFFIILGDAPHLEGKYTIWGRVIYGMEFTDVALRGQPPVNPDRIEQIRVLADIPTLKLADAEIAQ